jgi:hypothetical protein
MSQRGTTIPALRGPASNGGATDASDWVSFGAPPAPPPPPAPPVQPVVDDVPGPEPTAMLEEVMLELDPELPEVAVVDGPLLPTDPSRPDPKSSPLRTP